MSDRARDPHTGQLRRVSVCGRKFCTVCGKWRHVLYFRPRLNRNGREYMQPECDTCHNLKNKQYRKTMAGEVRQRRQEYERMQKEGMRRRAGVPQRKLRPALRRQPPLPRLDAVRVREYLWRRYYFEDDDHRYLLNGIALTSSDTHLFRRIKEGEQTALSLGVADRLAVWYDIPLWEIEEVGSEAA